MPRKERIASCISFVLIDIDSLWLVCVINDNNDDDDDDMVSGATANANKQIMVLSYRE